MKFIFYEFKIREEEISLCNQNWLSLRIDILQKHPQK